MIGKFYVCGIDPEGSGTPIFLRSRPFDSEHMARAYAATCHPSLSPFVVRVVWEVPE